MFKRYKFVSANTVSGNYYPKDLGNVLVQGLTLRCDTLTTDGCQHDPKGKE